MTERLSDSVDAKLRAIAQASRCEFPSGDIGDMLQEIDAGRQVYGETLPFPFKRGEDGFPPTRHSRPPTLPS